MTSDPVARYLAQRNSASVLSARLRPMSTGELVDASLRLYQRIGLTCLRLTVVPALLCLASVSFVTEFVVPGLTHSPDGGSFLTHVGEVSVALGLAVFVGGPLFLSGLSYTTCLVVSLASDWVVGNAVDPTAAQDIAKKSMPRMFATNMRELVLSLSGIVIAGALLLGGEWLSTVTPETDVWSGVLALVGVLGLIAGSFIFFRIVAKDAMIAPITVIENLDARSSIKRSRDLMKFVPFHGSGIGAVTSIYSGIACFPAILFGGLYAIEAVANVSGTLEDLTSGMMLQPLFLHAANLLPAFLTIWAILPVWAISITMLYFDRRIRLEGFDIEILGLDLARKTRSNRFQL